MAKTGRGPSRRLRDGRAALAQKPETISGFCMERLKSDEQTEKPKAINGCR